MDSNAKTTRWENSNGDLKPLQYIDKNIMKSLAATHGIIPQAPELNAEAAKHTMYVMESIKFGRHERDQMTLMQMRQVNGINSNAKAQ